MRAASGAEAADGSSRWTSSSLSNRSCTDKKYGAQIGLHLIFAPMRKALSVIFLFFFRSSSRSAESRLPFGTVFKGRDQFDRLVSSAREGNWKSLPIGERTATVGRALVGTRYRNYTLEIDNRIEAPSVNFNALDCWTFFEISLAFARMLDEPAENWTPERLLHYIELDRYRGGQCTGEYLSRLHYLEDWLADNDRRGLVEDLTRSLGGVSVPHSAREMTVGWRHYRYLAANRSLCLGRCGKWRPAFRAARFTRFQRAASRPSKGSCAAAISLALFPGTGGVSFPLLMWDWRFAMRMARCISCTPRRRATMDAW